jgi:hypothetical protein
LLLIVMSASAFNTTDEAVSNQRGNTPQRRSTGNAQLLRQLPIAGVAPTGCAVEVDAEQDCDPELEQRKQVVLVEDREKPTNGPCARKSAHSGDGLAGGLSMA